MVVMSNIGTSIAIAIAITPTMTNGKQQNALVSSAPAIATGRNQPRKLGYEKPKSNGKVPCPIHSFPDKPAKHSWANCSKNPTNQKKLALQSMVDAHHATIDDCYLSNNDRSAMESDHTEAVDDQNLDRCLPSNYNDAFITFLAPPPPACTKAAEKVEHGNKPAKKKTKTIASFKDNGKDMAYAQSALASAKGLEEPLAFSLERD
jgi:hypothetical protein